MFLGITLAEILYALRCIIIVTKSKKWSCARVEFFSRRRLLYQAPFYFFCNSFLLLVKIPQPGDSKGIFSALTLSCYVLTSDPRRI